MKQKLNKLKQVFAVTLAGILLFGCQDDFEDNIAKDSKQIRFEEVSLNDLLPATYNELFASVDKLEKKMKNTSAKTVYNSTYNFSYDDEKGIFISEGNYSSYTFPIKREGGDGKVENIVFSKKQDGTYETILVKYDLTEEELVNLTKEELLQSETILTDLNTGFSAAKCLVEVVMCNNDGSGGNGALHVAENGCCRENNASHLFTFTYSVNNCSGSGTGGSGGTSGSSTTGGSSNNGGSAMGGNTGGTSSSGTNTSGSSSPGGGSSSSPNPLITVPVANIKSPCTLLKTLMKDPPFRGKMANLSGATNWAFEKGFTLYNKEIKNTLDNFSYTPFQGNVNSPIANYNYDSATIQGMIHSHFGGLLSIFSPIDLQDLYLKMKNQDVTDNYFAGVVTASGTAYIMQMEDRAAFIAFGDKYLSSDSKLNNFGENFYLKKYGISEQNSKESNEKGFLKMMKEMNMGTNIAASPFTPNAPGNPDLFKNLTPIKYNPTTDKVEPQNCN